MIENYQHEGFNRKSAFRGGLSLEKQPVFTQLNPEFEENHGKRWKIRRTCAIGFHPNSSPELASTAEHLTHQSSQENVNIYSLMNVNEK